MTSETHVPHDDASAYQQEFPDHHAEAQGLRDKIVKLKQYLVLAGIMVALQSAIMVTVLLQTAR